MIFYSGFALKNDDKFFSSWLDDKQYTIAGFSYGAIKAFEYALKSHDRIDKLQLFSPAFFQTKKEKFLSMQLAAFSADAPSYLRQFVDNCYSPSLNDGRVELDSADYQDLKKLLEYVWDESEIKRLTNKGIEIEVYLGEKDRIIDAQKAFDFFTPHATVFFFKDVGHFLQK